MNKLGEFLRRFQYLGRRRELNRELEEEIHFHIEMKVRELMERGIPEDEAQFMARRELGNRGLVMEDSRGARRFHFLETLLRDIRYGFRTLVRNPVFTIAVVLTLALGIGVNTALFTLLNSVMFRSLPVSDPAQLYLFGAPTGMTMIRADGVGERHASFLSYPMYRQFREHAEGFSDLAALSSFPDHAYVGPEIASPGASVETADAWLVTGNFFSVLGVRAVLGRTFTPEDDEVPGAHPVVVLSQAFWSRHYGQDPGVIGRMLRMNGTPYTVIGVTPSDFSGVAPGVPVDIWVPMMMQAELRREPSYLDDMNTLWLRIIGRKDTGVTEEQAAAHTDALFRRLLMEEAGTDVTPDSEFALSHLSMELTPFGKGFGFMREQFSRPLLILMGVVAMVLLIACANVGNLLLARASGRQREMALRLALGSGRNRLVRQLLTESMILAFAGGAVGLLATWWTVDLLLALLSRSADLEAPLDSRILGFTLCVSVFTALLFGLVPALRATGVDFTSSLRDQGATSRSGRDGWRLRKALVVSQVAISLVLLIGAGLFVQSLENLRSQDTGFRSGGVLMLEIDPQGGGYTKEQMPQLYQELMERIEAIPNVHSASLSYYGLFSGVSRRNEATIDSFALRSREEQRIQDTFVTERYFETVGITLLAGRGFEPGDRDDAPRVAVVNETFARHFFGEESPAGKRFGVGGEGSGNDIEIVGVVSDLKYNDFREETPRYAYYPVLQQPTYLHSLEVRTDGDYSAVVAPHVRQAVTDVAEDLPILNVRTLEQQIDRTLRQDKLVSNLTGFFGLLALLLACLGLYGVMAFAVSQRTHEIGIRVALGARRAQVLWMVLRDSMTLVGIGIIMGIPAAMAVVRLASSLFFGLGSMEYVTMFGATVILFLVAVFAGFLPARRASRLDPGTALRHE